MLDDEAIAELFRSNPVFALVGASSDPARDAFDVMAYLLEQGFRVIPVNPFETEVHGEQAYPALTDVPEPFAVALVFRRSSYAAEVAASAIAAGARVVWLTLGVSSPDAAVLAAQAGVGFVEDRCAKATHRLMKRAGLL